MSEGVIITESILLDSAEFGSDRVSRHITKILGGVRDDLSSGSMSHALTASKQNNPGRHGTEPHDETACYIGRLRLYLDLDGVG